MEFDIWLLLAGVGILIFGMHTFEYAIKYLGGNKIKGILGKYTNGPLSSIFTGTLSTALLQSSSLVSLLVLAFTGAGVMALSNGIGVIIGANIGTTVSSLLVAFFGFGDFKISAFALPIIAVGGLMLIFVKDKRYVNWAKLFVGFGLLFLGLDFMKESVDAIKASFDLTAYKDLSLWKFGVLGIIVTAIIQSSSAVGVMTLAALSAGIITFPASIAIVMGSNIGTTFTGVIASLGGATIKRKVSLSQVIFNIISGIIGVVFFWQYIYLTLNVLGFSDNLVMGNAVLNAIFNISTAILFGFFLKPFTSMIERLIPEKAGSADNLHIDQLEKTDDVTLGQAAVFALQEDSKTLIDKAFAYCVYVFGIDEKDLDEKEYSLDAVMKGTGKWNKEKHIKLYNDTKKIGDALYAHIIPIKTTQSNEESIYDITAVDKSVHDSLRAIKSIKNVYHDIQDLKAAPEKELKALYQTLLTHTITVSSHIAAITNRTYSSENFKELMAAQADLQAFHKSFIEQLADIDAKVLKNDVRISTLINIDHYVTQAMDLLVSAVKNTYLNAQENEAFNQVN